MVRNSNYSNKKSTINSLYIEFNIFNIMSYYVNLAQNTNTNTPQYHEVKAILSYLPLIII